MTCNSCDKDGPGAAAEALLEPDLDPALEPALDPCLDGGLEAALEAGRDIFCFCFVKLVKIIIFFALHCSGIARLLPLFYSICSRFHPIIGQRKPQLTLNGYCTERGHSLCNHYK